MIIHSMKIKLSKSNPETIFYHYFCIRKSLLYNLLSKALFEVTFIYSIVWNNIKKMTLIGDCDSG